jgi:hypothetical protein
MEASAQKSQPRVLKRIVFGVCGTALLAGLLFVLAFADALGFFHDPPLRLERDGSTVTAHVERLGEYYCPVGRIRIQESDTGKVVYEAVAKKEVPAIFNFKLAAGANRTRLMGGESDSYSIVKPREDAAFTLNRGVHYRLTVWGDTWTFRRVNFVL